MIPPLPLTFPSPTTGYDAVTLEAVSATGSGGDVSSQAFSLQSITNLTISDLYVGSASVTAVDAFEVDNVAIDGIVVEHCRAPSSFGAGLKVTRATSFSLRDARFFNNTSVRG